MGALSGLRVVEMGGIGPGPFCGMMLADMGADILRIDRAPDADSGILPEGRFNVMGAGRRSVPIDLKHPDGVATALRLVEHADALIEGYRPGVMERLGLGPGTCLERNPRLVYGRMTGWGQDGPLARTVGHDINYLALTGALHAIGPGNGPPSPPLSLVGDYGGGGMMLAVGLLAALLEARSSGKGQVVDASIVDGAALLLTSVWSRLAAGTWQDAREANVLDGGAPYYAVYETRDGRYVSVGAIEPKFYRNLLGILGLSGVDLPAQNDRASWPALKARIAAVFRTRTRAEWEAAFHGIEACFAPVLSLGEAPTHPHNRARGVFGEAGGVLRANPSPRFSRTPSSIAGTAGTHGAQAPEALEQWGIPAEEARGLLDRGVIRGSG